MCVCVCACRASLLAQTVKKPPAMWRPRLERSLDGEDSQKKEWQPLNILADEFHEQFFRRLQSGVTRSRGVTECPALSHCHVYVPAALKKHMAGQNPEQRQLSEREQRRPGQRERNSSPLAMGRVPSEHQDQDSKSATHQLSSSS